MRDDDGDQDHADPGRGGEEDEQRDHGRDPARDPVRDEIDGIGEDRGHDHREERQRHVDAHLHHGAEDAVHDDERNSDLDRTAEERG